jgi:hypothetical protein
MIEALPSSNTLPYTKGHTNINIFDKKNKVRENFIKMMPEESGQFQND